MWQNPAGAQVGLRAEVAAEKLSLFWSSSEAEAEVGIQFDTVVFFSCQELDVRKRQI